MKRFVSTYSNCKTTRGLIFGRLPVRLFDDSFSDTRFVKLPMADGTLLPRLFKLRSSAVRPVNNPIDVGIDPTKPDPATVIDTTTEFEHTTAAHADVDGPVQMLPVFGTPPVHCHDEYAATDVALNAADNAHMPITSLLNNNTGTADGSSLGTDDGDGDEHTGVVPKRPAVELSFVKQPA